MPPLVEHPIRSMESPPLRSNGDTPNHHPDHPHPHHHHHHHHNEQPPLAASLRMALYDYDAQGEDELTLRKGQIVEVLSEDAKISGGCVGKNRRRLEFVFSVLMKQK